MKNILLIAVSFLMALNVNAQDAKKLLKSASKDFAKFNQDQIGNKDDLTTAIDAINQAFAIDGVSDDAGAWVTKGEIYNGIADSEMKSKLINSEYTIKTPTAATTALEAFKMALDKAAKKTHTKDAVNGLKENESHLSNMAITHFQKGNYADSYENFKAANLAHDLLKANGADSRLDDAAVMKDQSFYTAISGYYGEKGDEVLPLFKKLYAMGSEEALVYEALYSLTSSTNKEEALGYLNEGRKKFPENTSLLFSLINHYLGAGELDKLVENLKAAMAAEPDNVSVINTTGNVYEQLSNKENEAGNAAKATEYMDLAKDYYGQALAKDPDNFDANYSIGAVYYNDAASMTATINELAQDYSAAGTKKYETANAKMMSLFDKALPYFEKAYAAKGDDSNTMIALKEIYVRKGNMDKANELKAKMGQ